MASNFDRGPFIPVGTTPKIRITASDVVADVLDNKVVVVSPLAKVTLNPGGNEQMRVFVNEVGGVWITRQTDTTNFNVTNAATFLPIGTQSSPTGGEALIGDAQFRCPRDARVTSIYVRLNTALTGIQTLTCQLNVGGSIDTGITVTHTSSTGTLLGVAGEVLIDQDELVCYEFTFGGGLTTAAIVAVTATYAVAPE